MRHHVGTKLPLAFTDLGEQQVKNIAQPLRAYRIGGASVAAVAALSPPLPDKPSIAVLPFANMSGDPEQEYFVDGMVEEIITALSRIRWLFVIARNSTFTYKGQGRRREAGRARARGALRPRRIGVAKPGNRVRITGQLIDTTTGAHIWAEPVRRRARRHFELQDQVASERRRRDRAQAPPIRDRAGGRVSRLRASMPTTFTSARSRSFTNIPKRACARPSRC